MTEKQNQRDELKEIAEEKKKQRRQAREYILGLLYESDVQPDIPVRDIYDRAVDCRDLTDPDGMVWNMFSGVSEHIATLDEALGRHARGWRTDRLSLTTRCILRMGAYELLYCPTIHYSIAINEAVELAKKFDDPKARAFVNGVLNAIKDEKINGPEKSGAQPDGAEPEQTEGTP